MSTDKVDSEIPSPYDGVLLEILVRAGETVPVGTVLARIGEPGAAGAAAGPGGGHRLRPRPRTGRPAAPVARTGSAEAGRPQRPRAVAAGPPARRRGRAGRLRDPGHRGGRPDPAGGRGAAIAGGGARAAAPAAAAPAAAAPPAGSARLPCGGRPRRAAAPAAAAATPAGPTDPRDEVVQLSRMRLAVAAGMKKLADRPRRRSGPPSRSTSTTSSRSAAKHKDRFKKETGASLSYLPFISRAVVDALRAYPTVNSSIDIEAKTMTLHPYVNLGIAVDLDQQGLVVPVLRDADGLNMRGIAKGITELAAAARNKKLGMSDMQGSTFTITNPGPFASYASAPIINQPNTGILCTDGVKRRPVAVGDAIAIHPTGIIGLVYDHRAFDGSTASLFLMHIRDSLEKRDWEAEVG